MTVSFVEYKQPYNFDFVVLKHRAGSNRNVDCFGMTQKRKVQYRINACDEDIVGEYYYDDDDDNGDGVKMMTERRIMYHGDGVRRG